MFTVPEGYFEDLQQRLLEIPGRSKRVTPWMKLKPYLAMAAMLAVVLMAGTLILHKTVPAYSDELSQEELAMASNPYMMYSLLAESSSATASEEDYIEYMILTGINIDYYETDY